MAVSGGSDMPDGRLSSSPLAETMTDLLLEDPADWAGCAAHSRHERAEDKMNLNAKHEPLEGLRDGYVVVGTCDTVAVLPASEEADFYRGHYWVSVSGLICLAVVLSALALA